MVVRQATRVLVLWSRISGYMSACWRHLASESNLKVVAWSVDESRDNVGFRLGEKDDHVALLGPEDRDDAGRIGGLITEFRPDVVLTAGWMSQAYQRAIARRLPSDALLVMAMDTPWRGFLRETVTKCRHAKYLRRVDHVVVAGERAYLYARRLGFMDSQVTRGLYAWDETIAIKGKAEHKWREDRAWLFVGRYVPEKGIPTLIQAYANYRRRIRDPWPLVCCGAGPMKALLQEPGVIDRGFVTPDNLPGVFGASTVFILPSVEEPWGVVLAEAMGCGLPAIATQACGAAIDLIRDPYNGRLIAPGCETQLADAMVDLHQRENELPILGNRAAEAAEPFKSVYWSQRLMALIRCKLQK